MWDKIFHLVDKDDPDYVTVRWMPSHLDEKQKIQQLKKYLQLKIVTERDIEGNVKGDNLADLDAALPAYFMG